MPAAAKIRCLFKWLRYFIPPLRGHVHPLRYRRKYWWALYPPLLVLMIGSLVPVILLVNEIAAWLGMRDHEPLNLKSSIVAGLAIVVFITTITTAGVFATVVNATILKRVYRWPNDQIHRLLILGQPPAHWLKSDEELAASTRSSRKRANYFGAIAAWLLAIALLIIYRNIFERGFTDPYVAGFVLFCLAIFGFGIWEWVDATKLKAPLSTACKHCGYDLRETPAVCPECGTLMQRIS